MSEIDPIRVVIAMAVLIASLSFHEAAHAWTANKLGDPTARKLGRLTLNPLAHIDWIGTVLFPLIATYTGFPLIGWAKPVPVNSANLRSPRWDFAVVAFAGPVSNVLLAFATASVLAVVPHDYFNDRAFDVLQKMLFINVLLAVFNMIPLPPLDGGNILAGIVPEPIAKLIDLIRPFGFIVLLVLMFTGVLSQIILPAMVMVDRWLPK